MIGSRLVIASAAILALGAGCATVKVDPGRCDKVGSVAVVGYDVRFVRNAERSENKLVNMINTAKTVSQLASGDLARQQEEQATIAYDVIVDGLAQGFAWKIVPYEQVVADPVYARLREKYEHRLSNGTPRLSGLLGGGAANAFEPGEQAELAQSLGVEGLVSLEVGYWRVRHSRVSVADADIGRDYLQARIGLTVMDGGEKPAWRDIDAVGDLSDKRMPVVMGVQTDSNLSQAMHETTVSAVGALFARFQAARYEAEQRMSAQAQTAPVSSEPAEASAPAAAVAPAATPATEAVPATTTEAGAAPAAAE